jgi:hypothetical protein
LTNSGRNESSTRFFGPSAAEDSDWISVTTQQKSWPNENIERKSGNAVAGSPSSSSLSLLAKFLTAAVISSDISVIATVPTKLFGKQTVNSRSWISLMAPNIDIPLTSERNFKHGTVDGDESESFAFLLGLTVSLSDPAACSAESLLGARLFFEGLTCESAEPLFLKEILYRTCDIMTKMANLE